MVNQRRAKMSFSIVATLAALIAAAPSASAKDLDQEADQLIKNFQGTYSGRIPKLVFGDKVLQSNAWAVAKPVSVDIFPNHKVIYLELRNDGPDGPPLLHRLFVLDNASDRLRNSILAYKINDSDRWKRADLDPKRLAGIKIEDLKLFQPNCDIGVFVDHGDLTLAGHKDRCIIRNPNTGQMTHMEFLIKVAPLYFEFAEHAFDEDGNVIFEHVEPAHLVKEP